MIYGGAANLFFIVFVGTTIGGYVAAILTGKVKKEGYIHVFSGGLLLGLICFELLPEAFRELSFIGVAAGIFFGVYVMITLDIFIHRKAPHTQVGKWTIFLPFFALLVHSIPTGLALGLNLQQQLLNPTIFLAAAFFHHIPEGFILMGVLINSRGKAVFFIGLCTALSITVGLSSIIGAGLQPSTVKLPTMLNGIAIGTLSYITFYESIWKNYKKLPRLKAALVLFLGALLIYILLILMPMEH